MAAAAVEEAEEAKAEAETRAAAAVEEAEEAKAEAEARAAAAVEEAEEAKAEAETCAAAAVEPAGDAPKAALLPSGSLVAPASSPALPLSTTQHTAVSWTMCRSARTWRPLGTKRFVTAIMSHTTNGHEGCVQESSSMITGRRRRSCSSPCEWKTRKAGHMVAEV
jgi:hypothetical protein